VYFSPNIFGVIKLRRMKWVGHIACVGREELYAGSWLGNSMERDHLEDPSLDGRIILRWISTKWEEEWTGLIWLRIKR